MIFPSVRAFPAAPLGRALVQWEYKPPYLKGLFIGGAVVAVFIALIYTFFAAPEQLDFLRSYASILLYIAVPLISFFFGKLILTTRNILCFTKRVSRCRSAKPTKTTKLAIGRHGLILCARSCRMTESKFTRSDHCNRASFLTAQATG